MLQSLERIFAKRATIPEPFEREPWVVPEAQKAQFTTDGYCRFQGLIDDALIERVLQSTRKFRTGCGEKKDEFGYGQRIGLLHISNNDVLELALHAKVQKFLHWAFGAKPLLFGSLLFEAGTEQTAHRDNIFFYTEPQDHMAGVWIALEDVHADAGPLFYYPGSHRWPVIRGETVRAELSPDDFVVPHSRKERQALADRMGRYWTEMLMAQIAEHAATPVPVIAKRGDVIFWHALLVHGGQPRRDRALSRNSMVAHFISRDCGFWDNQSYFLLENHEFKANTMFKYRTRQSELGMYMRHRKTVTISAY